MLAMSMCHDKMRDLSQRSAAERCVFNSVHADLVRQGKRKQHRRCLSPHARILPRAWRLKKGANLRWHTENVL